MTNLYLNLFAELLNELDDCAGESGVISFEDFVSLIQNHVLRQQEQEQELAGGGTGVGGDRLRPGPDPKVMEFIAILEEYRLKCEEDGNYLEAQRADSQLTALRRQEFKRQSKSLKARQIAERQDVQIAHNMQFNDFNQAWDQYMEEYDRMAQAYVKQMTEARCRPCCIPRQVAAGNSGASAQVLQRTDRVAPSTASLGSAEELR